MTVTHLQGGIRHIQTAFDRTGEQGRAALMPYYTIGFPDLPQSLEILEEIARAGADLIELGVPFSDPLADGPTIQHATQVALERGTTLGACLEVVSALRQRGVEQPLILMGYYNPILAYGIERFTRDAAAAGVDGLIVPDLPAEEAGELETACQAHELALIYLLAPTSTAKRIEVIAARSTAFIYLMSLTGVTGARQSLPPDLAAFIQRVRGQTDLPLAVGFGISTPQQARQVAGLAEGVIVGSAVIRAVEEAMDPCQAAGRFIQELSRGLVEQTGV